MEPHTLTTAMFSILGLYVALVVLFACAVCRGAVHGAQTPNAVGCARLQRGWQLHPQRPGARHARAERAGGGLAQRASDLEHLRSRVSQPQRPVAMGIAEAQLSYLSAGRAAGPILISAAATLA